MKTRNLTPFPFGTKVTSRTPPQLEMTLVLRGLFTLKPGHPVAPLQSESGIPQGFMTADVFHPDDDERRGECLYPSDFADYKPRADVLLRGTCHAPGGRPVTECPVELAVGAWSKRLRVLGRRVWTESVFGSPMSSPAPFVQMPLGYSSAFGGPEYRQNPAGRGYKTPELPTVELAEEPIRSRGAEPAPAGFGPINPAWPQRAAKVGKEYGRRWRAERAPFYAEDFDWSYFNAAPADQQLEGYLRGDEALGFTNLHPTAPSFQAALPGLRIRSFVKDVLHRVREVRMVLDTLFANLDDETLALTWRGLVRVTDQDLLDVARVVVASEPLASEPLPAEHYHAMFAEMEEDPLGIRKVLRPETAEIALAMTRRGKGGGFGPGSGPRPDPSLDPLSAHLAEKLGTIAPEVQQGIRTSMGNKGAVDALLGTARPGLDLRSMIAKAINDGAGQPRARAAPAPRPGEPPRIPLRDAVLQMRRAAETSRTATAGGGLNPPELAALEAAAHDPGLAALDPSLAGAPAEGVAPTEPGPGRDLRGRDLSGRDLSGQDLSFANLEGAILTGANLRATSLRGANLTCAILAAADLTGADLSGANLTTANLSRIVAVGVILDGATLKQTVFSEAKLERASLRGARGEQTVFSGANLAEAIAVECQLTLGNFSEAVLTQADFSRATLVRCAFLDAKLGAASFAQASLTKCSFARSSLERASFARARGEQNAWIGARLDHADFSYAVLPGAHFTEASLAYTRFFGADLRESRFYRASLDHTELVQCNLMSADLCRSTTTSTRFTGSNLYDAKFLQAAGAGCDFTDANLKTSTLERA